MKISCFLFGAILLSQLSSSIAQATEYRKVMSYNADGPDGEQFVFTNLGGNCKGSMFLSASTPGAPLCTSCRTVKKCIDFCLEYQNSKSCLGVSVGGGDEDTDDFKCWPKTVGDCDEALVPIEDAENRQRATLFAKHKKQEPQFRFHVGLVNPLENANASCEIEAVPPPRVNSVRLKLTTSAHNLDDMEIIPVINTRGRKIVVRGVIRALPRTGAILECLASNSDGDHRSVPYVVNPVALPRLSSPPRHKPELTTNSSITLEWNTWNRAVGDTGTGPIRGYQLIFRPSGSTSDWKLTPELKDPSNCLLHSVCRQAALYLKPNTEYDFAVRTARTGGGEYLGEVGAILANIKTECSPPVEPVRDVNTTETTQRGDTTASLLITWKAPLFTSCASVLTYHIEIMEGGLTVRTYEPGPTVTSKEVLNLDFNKIYTISIYYKNNENVRSPKQSHFQTIQAQKSFLNTPALISELQWDSLFLTWGAADEGTTKGRVAEYTISRFLPTPDPRGRRAVPFEPVSVSPAEHCRDSSCLYRVVGLEPNTVYQFVVAVGTLSGPPSIPVRTPCGNPSVPLLAQPVLVSPNNLTQLFAFSWSPAQSGCETVSYQLEVAEVPGNAVKVRETTYATNHSVLLTANTDFTGRVRSQNNVGNWSTWSESVLFTTKLARTTTMETTSATTLTPLMTTDLVTTPVITQPTYPTGYPTESAVTTLGVTTKVPSSTKAPVSLGPTEMSTSSGLSIPLVVVIICCGIVLVIFLICITLCIVLRRKKKRRKPAYLDTWVPEEHVNSGFNMPDVTQVTQATNLTNISNGTLNITDDDSYSMPAESHFSTIVRGEADGNLPIMLDNLPAGVRERQKNSDRGFQREFTGIPKKPHYSQDIAKQRGNKAKNRYGDVLPYDHNLVVLEYDGHAETNVSAGETHNNYVNASYISGYNTNVQTYIAAQGPNTKTVNDFWRLVWQTNTDRIIMITKLVEKGKMKCVEYWPTDKSCHYGALTVELAEEEYPHAVEVFAHYTIRHLRLRHAGGAVKIVRHFHFTAWPDQSVPIYPSAILHFIQKVRSLPSLVTDACTLVHCSAGVGRTGTYIALDKLLNQMRDPRHERPMVDIRGIVTQLRKERVNMVQTGEQYKFLYEAILEAYLSGETSIPLSRLSAHLVRILSPNTDTGGTLRRDVAPVSAEFTRLGELKPVFTKEQLKGAVDKQNLGKNRVEGVLPPDFARPVLVTPADDGNSYINAVNVDGVLEQRAYILTQMPMPNTVNDFWRLVIDHQVGCIVMMNPSDDADPTVTPYWPQRRGETELYGSVAVELREVTNTAYYTKLELTARNTNMPEPRVSWTVYQYQFVMWPKLSSLPLSKEAILDLLAAVRSHRQPRRPTVIHCLDGATRSGLLAILALLQEQVTCDDEVDVFRHAKVLRNIRPRVLPHLEQYTYSYQMVAYMAGAIKEEDDSIYANN